MPDSLRPFLFVRLFAGLVVAGATSVCVLAQTIDWRRLHPTHAPAARRGHSIALDEATGRIVVFGGTNGLQTFDDTWVWNGQDWSEIPSPVRPAARTGAAMGWDPVSRSIVLFGGNVPGRFVTDTWRLTDNGWLQIPTPVSPPYPLGARIEADLHTGACFLFAPGVEGMEVYEFLGTTWRRVPAPSGPGPLLQFEYSSYSPGSRGVLGLVAGAVERIWLWSDRRWSPFPAPLPPERGPWMFSVDRDRDAVVIGRVFALPGRWAFSLFELQQGRWVQGPAVDAPGPMVWDPIRGALVGFGTDALFHGVPLTDATYEFGPDGRPGTATEYGAGCPSGMPLRLSALGSPDIGTVFDLGLSGVPSTAVHGALQFGLSRDRFGARRLPLSLDPLGLTGCSLLQSADEPGLSLRALRPPEGSASLPFPNRIELVGRMAWLQAVVVAPGINPAGAVTSNGVEITLGR